MKQTNLSHLSDNQKNIEITFVFSLSDTSDDSSSKDGLDSAVGGWQDAISSGFDRLVAYATEVDRVTRFRQLCHEIPFKFCQKSMTKFQNLVTLKVDRRRRTSSESKDSNKTATTSTPLTSPLANRQRPQLNNLRPFQAKREAAAAQAQVESDQILYKFYQIL